MHVSSSLKKNSLLEAVQSILEQFGDPTIDRQLMKRFITKCMMSTGCIGEL